MLALELIGEAVKNGASLNAACKCIGINERTYYRWKKNLAETGSIADSRPTAQRPEPAILISRKIFHFFGSPNANGFSKFCTKSDFG
ncbi:MAG: helix-turn-helix domain-containing protein [Desulfovibrio sp.]|nr:helix-turn-helix domain-containing protein [Desulfovibrio sp.]